MSRCIKYAFNPFAELRIFIMTAMSDNSLNEIRLDRFQLNVSLIIQTLSTCGHQVWLSDDQCIAQLDIIFPTLYKTVIYLEQFFLNECRYALVSCQPNDDVQTELISILLSCHKFCYGSYGKYPWWLRITREGKPKSTEAWMLGGFFVSLHIQT